MRFSLREATSADGDATLRLRESRKSANELNPKLAQADRQKSSIRRGLGDIEGANLDRTFAVKLGIK